VSFISFFLSTLIPSKKQPSRSFSFTKSEASKYHHLSIDPIMSIKSIRQLQYISHAYIFLCTVDIILSKPKKKTDQESNSSQKHLSFRLLPTILKRKEFAILSYAYIKVGVHTLPDPHLSTKSPCSTDTHMPKPRENHQHTSILQVKQEKKRKQRPTSSHYTAFSFSPSLSLSLSLSPPLSANQSE
jgi:hypothetical protein